MTKQLKKLINLAFIGVGFGSFFYLITKLFLDNPTTISRYEVIHYWIMSILISWYSLLFKSNKLSNYSLFPLHFVLTFMTVVTTNYLTLSVYTIKEVILTFIIFFVIYVIVFITISIQNKQSIHRINQIINNKRDN
ncbi:hypothetical protein BW731_01020 [Vagococcus martis]|uniref:DUF3021 domain-containing protein n=1 Tax=Vagococcus martis TaxID=1768210 RepID=A0A1V4DF67_9ENTE|nr:hypothetical protein BW731_01020 [Vagococcus martis]